MDQSSVDWGWLEGKKGNLVCCVFNHREGGGVWRSYWEKIREKEWGRKRGVERVGKSLVFWVEEKMQSYLVLEEVQPHHWEKMRSMWIELWKFGFLGERTRFAVEKWKEKVQSHHSGAKSGTWKVWLARRRGLADHFGAWGLAVAPLRVMEIDWEVREINWESRESWPH